MHIILHKISKQELFIQQVFAVDTAAQNAAEDRGLKGKIYENRIKGQSTMHRDTVLCNLLQQAIQVKTTT